MKTWVQKHWPALSLVAIVLGYLGISAVNAGHGYTCVVTTVSSQTTPVAIATPGYISTFYLHNETSSAASLQIFPYVGTVPTAAPSPAAYMELPVGGNFYDAMTCDSPLCEFAIGQGWAAVVAAAGTDTVDYCGR